MLLWVNATFLKSLNDALILNTDLKVSKAFSYFFVLHLIWLTIKRETQVQAIAKKIDVYSFEIPYATDF